MSGTSLFSLPGKFLEDVGNLFYNGVNQPMSVMAAAGGINRTGPPAGGINRTGPAAQSPLVTMVDLKGQTQAQAQAQAAQVQGYGGQGQGQLSGVTCDVCPLQSETLPTRVVLGDLVGTWKMIFTTMPGADPEGNYLLDINPDGKRATFSLTGVRDTPIKGVINPRHGGYEISLGNLYLGTIKVEKIKNNGGPQQLKMTSLKKDAPYVWIVEKV